MKKFSIYILFTFIAALTAGLSSCSESDGEAPEFDDWQAKNEAYFDQKYNEVKSIIAGGSTEWKIFRSWSLEESVATHSYDNILVDVLQSGNGSGCPLYTDSVKVHYCGRLLPSRSYVDGYMFDKSWNGTELNDSTDIPSKFGVAGLVPGFSTALMQMHIGDVWRVYIPHQLAYGSQSTPGAAYSTLIFDIKLVAYYRANSTTRGTASKDNVEGQRGEWIYE